MKAVAIVTAPVNVMFPVEFVRVTVGEVVVPVIVVPALLLTVRALTDTFPPIETVPAVPALTVNV